MSTKPQGLSGSKASEASTSNNTDVPTAEPPPYEPSRNFAIISFNVTDRIRLISFPQDDEARIQEIIDASWERGIQTTRPYNASTEIKLKGTPWIHSALDAKARQLVVGLLMGLHGMGWVYDASVKLCKKADEKDTLLFRKTPNPQPRSDWFSITFDQWNTLIVQGAPQELCHPLIQRFTASQWCKETVFAEDRIEIRLDKFYWIAHGEDTVKVRLMLLAIVEVLEQFGFSIYATLKAVNRAAGGGESDMLVCARRIEGNGLSPGPAGS